MEFKLPFPSLKRLSSLRICLHWANHKLGPFQDTECSDTLRERRSHLSLDSLQIPRSLKADVADVLCGVLEQLSFRRTRRVDQGNGRLLQEVQFFHFDAFGRFDVKRTLQPVFQIKVVEENDLSSLHELLTAAAYFWLLPEVDAIFRKMVAIASHSRQSEILMEGPQPELRHGRCHLVYRFFQEDAAQFLESIRCWRNKNRVAIVLKRESIAVVPSHLTRYSNFDAFKDHFDLFEPSEREAHLIKNVIYWQDRYGIDTKNQLDIITFLKQKNYQLNWMPENGILISQFLKELLIWPYASFFIASFKHLAPYLTSGEYFYLTGTIFVLLVTEMPAKLQYGALKRYLLADFWSVLMADKKQMYTEYLDYFPRELWDLEVKAPFLHNTIKTDLVSLLKATDKE